MLLFPGGTHSLAALKYERLSRKNKLRLGENKLLINYQVFIAFGNGDILLRSLFQTAFCFQLSILCRITSIYVFSFACFKVRIGSANLFLCNLAPLKVPVLSAWDVFFGGN